MTSIDPIQKTRFVSLDREAAFRLFTERMGEWWPMTSHSISGAGNARVRFDQAVGGRITEIAPDGTEYSWADVLAWNPPERFVVSWHPNERPVAASTLEVRFTADGAGCRIDLEHRGWEEFGQQTGRELRANYEPGWDMVLGALGRATPVFEDASQLAQR